MYVLGIQNWLQTFVSDQYQSGKEEEEVETAFVNSQFLYIFAILESLQCLTFLFFQKYLERQISYWIRLSLVTQVAVTTILASHFTAALGAADALHFLSFSLVFYPLRVCWWWQITDTYHKIVLPAMYLTSIAPKWLYVANWEEEGLELCQVTRRRLSRILQ